MLLRGKDTNRFERYQPWQRQWDITRAHIQQVVLLSSSRIDDHLQEIKATLLECGSTVVRKLCLRQASSRGRRKDTKVYPPNLQQQHNRRMADTAKTARRSTFRAAATSGCTTAFSTLSPPGAPYRAGRTRHPKEQQTDSRTCATCRRQLDICALPAFKVGGSDPPLHQANPVGIQSPSEPAAALPLRAAPLTSTCASVRAHRQACAAGPAARPRRAKKRRGRG